MIGRRQIPPLETKDQLLEWADRLVRVLQAGDANVDGAQVTKEQITANQANYLLDPGVLFRLSTDAPRTIHGFAGGTSGRLAGIVNVGANNLVIANQSATAEAANRVITGTGADVTLTAGQTCLIQYDSQTQRWRIIGASAGGGGGGMTNPIASGASGTLWGSDTSGFDLILDPNNVDTTGKVGFFSVNQAAFRVNSFGVPQLLVGSAASVDPSADLAGGSSIVNIGIYDENFCSLMMRGDTVNPQLIQVCFLDSPTAPNMTVYRGRGSSWATRTQPSVGDGLFLFGAYSFDNAGNINADASGAFGFEVDSVFATYVPARFGISIMYTDGVRRHPIYCFPNSSITLGSDHLLTPPTDHTVHIESLFNTFISLAIHAKTGQTADLTQWMDESDVVNTLIDFMGILKVAEINDPGTVITIEQIGMIVFDTNIGEFVGWDGSAWVQLSGTTVTAGHVIQENSSNLTQRANLNFQDGVVATDDAGNNQTDINVDYATTVASLNTDGSSAVGTAVKVARADHIHTIPSTLDTNARVGVRKNSTGSTSTRRRLNIIEGANITVTVADDSGDEEVDVTVAATGAGGGLTTLLNGRVWAMVCRTYTFNVTTIFALGGHNSPSVIGTTSFVEDTTGAYINHATSTALNAAAGWAWAQTDVRLEVGPDWEYLIKTGAAASDIQNTRIWCAFCTAAALDQSDAGVGNVAGFRFSTGAGDTKWQAVTRNAGSGLNTVTDTGVTVAADTRYKLRIDVRNTASINFYINDVLVANISTNLPATTTTGSPYATITNLSAGTARNLRLERMVVEQN